MGTTDEGGGRGIHLRAKSRKNVKNLDPGSCGVLTERPRGTVPKEKTQTERDGKGKTPVSPK